MTPFAPAQRNPTACSLHVFGIRIPPRRFSRFGSGARGSLPTFARFMSMPLWKGSRLPVYSSEWDRRRPRSPRSCFAGRGPYLRSAKHEDQDQPIIMRTAPHRSHVIQIFYRGIEAYPMQLTSSAQEPSLKSKVRDAG